MALLEVYKWQPCTPLDWGALEPWWNPRFLHSLLLSGKTHGAIVCLQMRLLASRQISDFLRMVMAGLQPRSCFFRSPLSFPYALSILQCKPLVLPTYHNKPLNKPLLSRLWQGLELWTKNVSKYRMCGNCLLDLLWRGSIHWVSQQTRGSLTGTYLPGCPAPGKNCTDSPCVWQTVMCRIASWILQV